MNNSKLFSDEAANIYERAIGTLLKKNMLLYFSFGDYEEVIVQPSDQFSISFFSRTKEDGSRGFTRGLTSFLFANRVA